MRYVRAMTDNAVPDDTVPAASERRRRDIPLAVISVGMATVVWWPSFTLGAWGVLFFDQLLTLWAASTAAFVFVLFERRPVGRRLLRAFLLLLPSVWLVFSFIDFDTTDVFTFLATAFALLVVLIASPLTVWVLARIMWPDFGQNSTHGNGGSSWGWSSASAWRRSCWASTRRGSSRARSSRSAATPSRPGAFTPP